VVAKPRAVPLGVSQSVWSRGSAVVVPTTPRRGVTRSSRLAVSAAISNSRSQQQTIATDPSSGRVANEPAPKDLARRWREIAGENDWDGLLDPLDLTLREELLRYGEFVQATYDTFDFDEHSKYCGSARYNKAKMFDKVGLFNTGYEVTRYFYATANVEAPFFLKKPAADRSKESWSTDSNWMGYVAVCTDEEKVKQLGRRDILIAWRGTIRNSEWVANMKQTLSPAAMDKRPNEKRVGPPITVETGFLGLYTSKNPKTRYNKTSARTQVLTELKRLLDKYEGEELSITICGHSLGSALATINAYDIAQSGLNIPGDHAVVPEDWEDKTAPPAVDLEEDKKTIPVTVYSFAGPRVGNDAFRDRLKELDVKVLRIVNVNDIVPRCPGLFINENTDGTRFLEKIIDQFPFTYIHVGTELELNNLDSPYLDPGRANKPNVHNMEQYLHLIDGHQGKGRKFELTTGRQLALVNKSCNFLKPSQFVPECWWQQENKGLVMTKDRKWVQPDRELEDIPTADEDFS